jgi:hypothetical protein
MNVRRMPGGPGARDGRAEVRGDGAQAGGEAVPRVRRVGPWLAVAVFGLGLAGLAAPAATLARERAVLRFVPGFGLVRSTRVRGALAHPLTAGGTGRALVVLGLLARARGTEVRLYVPGAVPVPHDATLRGADGHVYRQSGYAWAAGLGYGGGVLSFPPLRGVPRRLTLTLPGTPRLQAAIPLGPASALLPARAFGPTVAHHGVAVAVRVERTATHSLVEALAERVPAGTYAVAFNWTAPPRLAVGVDRSAPLRLIPGFGGPLQDFRGPRLAVGVRSVTVTVPTVDVVSDAALDLTVPVPRRGGIRIGRTFTLWPARVDLVRVRRLANARLALDFAYPGPIMLADPGIGDVHPLRAGPNGEMLAGTVAIPSGARSVTVRMAAPGLVAVGPWRFTLPVSSAAP